jgi:hypothetical protein
VQADDLLRPDVEAVIDAADAGRPGGEILWLRVTPRASPPTAVTLRAGPRGSTHSAAAVAVAGAEHVAIATTSDRRC